MNILSKLSKLGQAILYQNKRKVTLMCCQAVEKMEHNILILSNKIDRVAVTNMPSYIFFLGGGA